MITSCAEFAYARLIIAQQALHGYYLTKPNDEKRYVINHYGKVEEWLDGLFDAWDKMAFDIIRAGGNTRYKEIHGEPYNMG